MERKNHTYLPSSRQQLRGVSKTEKYSERQGKDVARGHSRVRCLAKWEEGRAAEE